MDDRTSDTGMMILSIETSVPTASLCLSEDGRVLSCAAWTAERNHDAYLFPALQEVMNVLGERRPDVILIGAGPGSYGGVRVALAAGVGIAEVTGARLISLCSWAQLAEGKACVVSDARRGGWTLRRPNGEITVVTTEELQDEISKGLLLYTTEQVGMLESKGLPAPHKAALTPTAEGLVRTWESMTEAERDAAARRPAEPIYVRPPHITKALHKPWEIRK